MIIGDFDSLGSKDISSYQQAGVEISQYPTHKDETDLELALYVCINHEVTHVFIIGALGNRWDMTIANILLAVHHQVLPVIHSLIGWLQMSLPSFEGKVTWISMVDQDDTLSLIPLGGDARGITTHGLVYPLIDETLYFGSSRGVSNVILSDQAQVIIRDRYFIDMSFESGRINNWV